MNINSEFGGADAAGIVRLVRLVRDNGIGLLTVQEHSQAVGVLPDTPFQMPTVRLRMEADGESADLEVSNVHALPPVDVASPSGAVTLECWAR